MARIRSSHNPSNLRTNVGQTLSSVNPAGLAILSQLLLIAHPNVVAAFDHVSGAAAVLVPVAQPMRFQVVDEDGRASLDGDPGVGSAAPRVNAGIGDSKSAPAVHFHVGRPAFRGADAFVRATRPAVRVLGYQRAITEAGLFWHCTVRNISQRDRGQMRWR